jgi:hypothetical protein
MTVSEALQGRFFYNTGYPGIKLSKPYLSQTKKKPNAPRLWGIIYLKTNSQISTDKFIFAKEYNTGSEQVLRKTLHKIIYNSGMCHVRRSDAIMP